MITPLRATGVLQTDGVDQGDVQKPAYAFDGVEAFEVVGAFGNLLPASTGTSELARLLGFLCVIWVMPEAEIGVMHGRRRATCPVLGIALAGSIGYQTLPSRGGLSDVWSRKECTMTFETSFITNREVRWIPRAGSIRKTQAASTFLCSTAATGTSWRESLAQKVR